MGSDFVNERLFPLLNQMVGQYPAISDGPSKAPDCALPASRVAKWGIGGTSAFLRANEVPDAEFGYPDMGVSEK